MKRLRKARFVWVYPIAVWLFATANTSEPSMRFGLLVVVLGEARRLWANGYVGHVKVNVTQHPDRPKIGQLITAGPYAYVRNPLYVGTFIIGLGFCIAVQNILLALTALVCFAVFYRVKAAREHVTLLKECGDAYATYQRAVPAWRPRWRPYEHRRGQWGWQGIVASKELKTVAWLGVALLALYFREELWQERELFGAKHWLKHSLLAALLLALIISDGTFELIHRFRRRPSAQPS